ncbi:hypothetical protein ACOME3_009871 [Neoechinorhynchus agilis]
MNALQCALSSIVGIYAIYIGTVNLSPNFDGELHIQHKEMFGHLNRVFPFYSLTNYRPYARNYRCSVGLIEIIAGSTLLTGQLGFKKLAALVLLGVQILLLRSEHQLNQYFKFFKLDMISIGILLILVAFVLNSGKDVREERKIRTSTRRRSVSSRRTGIENDIHENSEASIDEDD